MPRVPAVLNPTWCALRIDLKGKKYSDSKSKAEAGLGLPSFGPRVPSFGRGVMMGTYVQDLMGLDEGASKAPLRGQGSQDRIRPDLQFPTFGVVCALVEF